DISEGMLGQARRKAADQPLVRFERQDANALAVRGTFDGAFANFGVLNCVADLGELAARLADRLRPGARLVAAGMPPFWLGVAGGGRGGPPGRETWRRRHAAGARVLPLWETQACRSGTARRVASRATCGSTSRCDTSSRSARCCRPRTWPVSWSAGPRGAPAQTGGCHWVTCGPTTTSACWSDGEATACSARADVALQAAAAPSPHTAGPRARRGAAAGHPAARVQPEAAALGGVSGPPAQPTRPASPGQPSARPGHWLRR